MKIVKQADAEVIKYGNLESREYKTNDPDINLAVVKVSGRHPVQSYTVNTKCKELLYVLSGSGSITVNDEHYELGVSDEIIVDQNEPYYLEGNFTVATICTPPWSLRQVKNVDKEGNEL